MEKYLFYKKLPSFNSLNTLLKRSDMSTNDLRFSGNASTNLELMCRDGYLHGHKRILASKFHTFLEAFFPSCKYLHDGEKPWPLAPPSSHVLYKTKICYYVERGRLRLCSLRCRPPPPTSKSMLLWEWCTQTALPCKLTHLKDLCFVYRTIFIQNCFLCEGEAKQKQRRVGS